MAMDVKKRTKKVIHYLDIIQQHAQRVVDKGPQGESILVRPTRNKVFFLHELVEQHEAHQEKVKEEEKKKEQEQEAKKREKRKREEEKRKVQQENKRKREQKEARTQQQVQEIKEKYDEQMQRRRCIFCKSEHRHGKHWMTCEDCTWFGACCGERVWEDCMAVHKKSYHESKSRKRRRKW